MYGQNGTAIADALVYHQQPLASVLGSPSVGAGSAAMGVVDAFKVNGPTPESGFHYQAKQYTGGKVEMVQAMPQASPATVNVGAR